MVSYYLFSNTQANLQRQSIATGFGFLDKEAGFEIGESLIDYSAADSYSRALLVGALNTLKVSFIGIIFTLILGTIVGIARLSSNWLVAKLAGGYIEVMQNIPVLLQLFFWYAIFYEAFPSPRQALQPLRRGFPLQPRPDFRRPRSACGPCRHGLGFRCRPGDRLGVASLGAADARRVTGQIFPVHTGDPGALLCICRCWSGVAMARRPPWMSRS